MTWQEMLLSVMIVVVPIIYGFLHSKIVKLIEDNKILFAAWKLADRELKEIYDSLKDELKVALEDGKITKDEKAKLYAAMEAQLRESAKDIVSDFAPHMYKYLLDMMLKQIAKEKDEDQDEKKA